MFLILDEIRRTPAALNGGDVGGKLRVVAGQRDQRGAGAERGVVGVAELQVHDDAGTPDRRGDRHGEQAEHKQLLAPFAAEQPPAPADHRPAGDDAARASGQVGGVAQRDAHRTSPRREERFGAGRPGGLAGHPPVAQEHHPVGPGGQLRVVGHHHRGHAPLAGLVQQPHHLVRVHRVQGAGRLVGQHQAAVPHHRAGDGDPLPLAPGQLIGKPARLVSHAERFQRGQPGRARLRHRDAVQFQRQGDVLDGGQPGQQVEILEHVPDHPAPQPDLAAPRHPRQRHAADQHVPAGGFLQAPGDGEQRGLARPAGPHHRHHLPGPHRQVHPAQRVHLGRLLTVGLGHAAQLQHAVAALAPSPSGPGRLTAGPPAGEAAEPEGERGRAGTARQRPA